MMLMGDKKKMAGLILKSKMPDKKSEDESMGMNGEDKMSEDIDVSPGLMAASKDIMSSIEAKDGKGLMQALKDFIYMCGEEKEAEVEKSEGE